MAVEMEHLPAQQTAVEDDNMDVDDFQPIEKLAEVGIGQGAMWSWSSRLVALPKGGTREVTAFHVVSHDELSCGKYGAFADDTYL